MKIVSIPTKDGKTEFDCFLMSISNKLAAAICRKLSSYAELGTVPSSSSLKILNPKIWGYQGTIYKLRIDCGKESARILFARNSTSDIVLLHGFLKRTRKTPPRDAHIAISNLQRMQLSCALLPLSLALYLLPTGTREGAD